MKKWLILISLGVLVVSGLLGAKRVVAAGPCSGFSYYPDPLYQDHDGVTFKFNVTSFVAAYPGKNYNVEVDCRGGANTRGYDFEAKAEGAEYYIKALFIKSKHPCIFDNDLDKPHNVSLYVSGKSSPECTNQFRIEGACNLAIDPTSGRPGQSFDVTGDHVSPVEQPYLEIVDPNGKKKSVDVTISGGSFSQSIGSFSVLSPPPYTVTLKYKYQGQVERPVPGCLPIGFSITESGTGPGEGKKCDECLWCEGEPKPEYWQECNNCVTGITLNGKPGSWTALGCIPNDPAEFVAWILARAVGIGGGIAFLIMLWGGFQIITSSGDPQKLNAGKDTLVSAAVGLLFIIFSIFLLRIIGVEILGLPGFNP